MRVLVTGNMGYVGPGVIRELRRRFDGVYITGLDQGYFAHCLTAAGRLPETGVNTQWFGDVRGVRAEQLSSFDAVVLLAAISNDPIGSQFSAVTDQVNRLACIEVARLASASGVRSVVFASSCSVYGFTESGECDEESAVNPLTTYAHSKVACEEALLRLGRDGLRITSLRFATACGASDRLRLDLVLNDFVASALTTGKIVIVSDGTPWRPLIDVGDMGRAIAWAVDRKEGAPGLVVNVGRNDWNFRVRDLAEAVARRIPGTSISVNESAAPDKRSYRVRFDRFWSLAPSDALPVATLEGTIDALIRVTRLLIRDYGLNQNFREDARVIRLRTLLQHIEARRLSDELFWIQ